MVESLYVTNSLDNLEKFLSCLKNLNPTQLSSGNKAKLNNLYEKFGFLLTYWEIYDKIGYFEHTIEESLWPDNQLKYLFENCITYAPDIIENERKLICTVCEIKVDPQFLGKHLHEFDHIVKYWSFCCDNYNMIWKNSVLERLMYGKFIEFRANNTLYCRICAVVIPASHVNLLGHINGSKHKMKFCDIINFKVDCSHSNAPKFSPVHTSVSMNADLDEKNCIIESIVSDNHISVENACEFIGKQNLTHSQPDSKIKSGVRHAQKGDAISTEFNNKKEKLTRNLKLLVSDLLSNYSKLAPETLSVFYCYPCDTWITNNDERSDHLRKTTHETFIKSEPKNKMFNCDCCINIFSEQDFFMDHKSSMEHKLIKEYIMKKVCKSQSNCNLAEVGPSSLYLAEVSDSSISYTNSDIASDISVTDSTKDCSKSGSKNSRKKSKKTIKQQNHDYKKLHCWYGVTGLSTDVKENDIKEGFSKFGDVDDVILLEPNSANIKVKLRKELRKDGSDIATGGVFVTIKHVGYEIKGRNTYECRFPPEIITNFKTNQEKFLETLFNQVAEQSQDSLRLFGSIMLKTEIVETDIKNALNDEGHGLAQVFTIGSRATGLAQNDSLHDLFIDLDGDYYGNKQEDHLKLVEKLKIIEKSLKSTQYCKFINVGIEGNCILADHCLTKRKCKIFCSNGLLVENSLLTRAYVQSHNQIKELIIALKEWVKCTDLPKIVSGYAITWMVLNYLLQSKTALITPINKLKKKYEGAVKSISGVVCFSERISESDIINFNCDLGPMNKLLVGFFEFYCSRKIKMSVHCPATGKLVLKTKFPIKKFKLTRGICIQDPLELDKNLTECLQGGSEFIFKMKCKEMAKLLTKKPISTA